MWNNEPLYKVRPAGYLPVVVGLAVGVVFCLPRVRGSIGRLLERPSAPAFLVSVAALALGLRLAAVFFFPLEPVNDQFFFHRYAVNLLAGKGYGNLAWPSLLHLSANGGGPKAFYPPGMTLLLTAWYWLTTTAPLSGKLLNTLIGVVQVLLIYDIARRTTGSLVARWAALLAAVLPTLVIWSASLGYEVVLGTLLCAIIDLALLTLSSQKRRWLPVAVLGLLLGFACLVKPIALLIPGMLLVWWLYMGAGWRAVGHTAAVVVLMALVVAPWTVRNYQVLGKFVLVSSNGGYMLYNANHPGATGIHLTAEPLPGEVDEVAMDHLRRRAAFQWMRENPDRVGMLALVKATLTWGTASTVMSFVSADRLPVWQESLFMALLNVAWTALLVVCVSATWTTGVWRQRSWYLALLLLAYLFGIHLLAEAETRHHITVLGPILLVAAYGLAHDDRPRPASVPAST